jgi:tRNA-2-methylthio-N6-dimethylallyladenosine synthase
LNTNVKVLVEGPSKSNKDFLCGYTEHNKLVNFKGNLSDIGSIINLHITEAKTWSLKGEVVHE